jgi:hypothetical protein
VIVILDPYVTARALSTPASLLAIGYCQEKKTGPAAAWLLITAMIHPQMFVYALIACMAVVWIRSEKWGSATHFAMAVLAGVPGSLNVLPARGVYREVLFSRSYFFVSNWAWYEWIGVFAPLAILGWFSLRPPRGSTSAFRLLTRVLVPFGLAFTAAAGTPDRSRGLSAIGGLIVDRAIIEREITIRSTRTEYYNLRIAAVASGADAAVLGIVAALSDITRQRELQELKMMWSRW